jgi:hypothetical protein
MGNDLDAKDAFAFGIDLQSQVAAVQLAPTEGADVRNLL